MRKRTAALQTHRNRQASLTRRTAILHQNRGPRPTATFISSLRDVSKLARRTRIPLSLNQLPVEERGLWRHQPARDWVFEPENYAKRSEAGDRDR